MTDRDTNGMQAQHWPAKDTSLTQKVADNLKIIVSDPKLRSLYEALTAVIIASVKDSYGKSSDKKYIYQTDMLMARVRKALSDKLPDLQTDSIKQMISDSSDKTSDTMSKLLLTAFKSLSVSIDKDTQSELISKIVAATDKLLQDYIAKAESGKNQTAEKKSTKKRKKTSQKQKVEKSELSKVLDALKTDKNVSQAKEDEIKLYQKKTSDLISKTLNTVNKSHKMTMESMTAGFKHTSQTISNEVSQLQDKLENVQSNSFGSGATNWFKTYIMEPVKLLLGGLWKFLLKPIFYVGKFLLKPIGFLVKGIWDNFIKKPVSKLIELTGTVLGTLTSAASTALSVFFLTPKGAYALGYAVGYIWGRWIKPIAMPVLEFFKDKVLPIAKDIAKWSFDTIVDLIERIGKPLLEWVKGKSSFNDAIKKVIFGNDIYKKDEAGNLIKDKDGKLISEDWIQLMKKNILEPILSAIKNIFDYKFGEVTGAYGFVQNVLSKIGSKIQLFNYRPGELTLGNILNSLIAIEAINLASKVPLVGGIGITAAISTAVGAVLSEKLQDMRDEQDHSFQDQLSLYNADFNTKHGNSLKEISDTTEKSYIDTMLYAAQHVKAIKAEYYKAKAEFDKANDILQKQHDTISMPTGLELANVILSPASSLAVKAAKAAWYHTAYDKSKLLAEREDAQLRMKELEAQYNLTSSDFENVGKTNAIVHMQKVFDNRIKQKLDPIVKVDQAQQKVSKVAKVANNLVQQSTTIQQAKVSKVANNLVQQSTTIQQVQVDNLLSDMLKPLGTAAYIVNAQNNELEKVKSNILKDERAEQIRQIARSANVKVAEQSAKLAAKEYKTELDALFDAFKLEHTNSGKGKIFDRKVDKMFAESQLAQEYRKDQAAFDQKLSRLLLLVEQMYRDKGNSANDAKEKANTYINLLRFNASGLSSKDRSDLVGAFQ